ncbi:hypothetical protein UP10_36215 [Bradyrhizobium sp. LTSPM299]|nr:hypothetical protein UP10_36215 [Bradyrhizobium sp. LTSPM299]
MTVKRDKIAEKLGFSGPRSRGLLPINSSLDIQRPFLGVLTADERLVDVFSFTPDLGTPRT